MHDLVLIYDRMMERMMCRAAELFEQLMIECDVPLVRRDTRVNRIFASSVFDAPGQNDKSDRINTADADLSFLSCGQFISSKDSTTGELLLEMSGTSEQVPDELKQEELLTDTWHYTTVLEIKGQKFIKYITTDASQTDASLILEPADKDKYNSDHMTYTTKKFLTNKCL